jgi:glycosyltransferase involved in cell wall biosynthesis
MRVAIDARKIADFGIGTYIRGLLGGLLALESGDSYVALAPEGTELPPGVEHILVDAPHYSLRELTVVGRAAERAGVDLLHAPHYVVPMTRLPVVVTIHDLIHLHQPFRNPLKPLYARVMLRRAVRKASAILTVTDAVRRQIEEELGAASVFVTPNGIAIPPAPGLESTQPLSTERYFLYAGNDKPHKNVETLVEAFAIVRRVLPNVSLVLAGAPFTRFRAGEGVQTPGFVAAERLAELYRGAIALVMPSIEEGFGLPAAEAMAHGTAVITSRADALVEITGDAAIHVDAHDAAVLAEAMRRVASDAELRTALGLRGEKRARDLTWKRCAEATWNAYRTALDAARR